MPAASVTMRATLSVRSNFAITHLLAAAQAARDTYEVEQAHAKAALGPWFDEMMRLVLENCEACERAKCQCAFTTNSNGPFKLSGYI